MAVSDKIWSGVNINSAIFRKLYVVILMKNYFIQFWVCSVVGFLFFGVNGTPFVLRSGDIWVTGCNYVSSVNLFWRCITVLLLVGWLKLC